MQIKGMNDLIFRYQFNPTPHEIKQGCRSPLHPKAEEGIQLFNQRAYWLAHEALETAWLEEPTPARALYKGILQAGVMYLQIERNNLIGTLKMYRRSMVWLAPWPDQCGSVDVGRLKADLRAAVQAAQELGKGNLDQIDQGLFKPVTRISI